MFEMFESAEETVHLLNLNILLIEDDEASCLLIKKSAIVNI
jgi:hypothetical protein